MYIYMYIQVKCASLLMKRGANRHTLNYTNQPPNQVRRLVSLYIAVILN